MLMFRFSCFLFTLYLPLNTITPLLFWLTFNCHLIRKLSIIWSILVNSCSFSAITDTSSMNNNDAMVRYRYLVPKSFANNWIFRSSLKHTNSGPDNGLPSHNLSLTITSSVRPIAVQLINYTPYFSFYVSIPQCIKYCIFPSLVIRLL